MSLSITPSKFRRGETFHTVIVSDIHIGAPFGRKANLLLRALNFLDITDSIILNGDVIDLWVTPSHEITPEGSAFIKQIKSLSPETHYNRGNHEDLIEFGVKFEGLPLRLSTEFTVKKIKFRVEHGDRLEFVVRNFRDYAYAGAQIEASLARSSPTPYHSVLDGLNHAIFNGPLNPIQEWKRSIRVVDSFNEAIRDGIDVTINGHNHDPHIRRVSHEGRQYVYVNGGDWVLHSTFVGIKEDGSVYLVTVDPAFI